MILDVRSQNIEIFTKVELVCDPCWQRLAPELKYDTRAQSAVRGIVVAGILPYDRDNE